MIKKQSAKMFSAIVCTAALSAPAVADDTHGKRYLGANLGFYSLDAGASASVDLNSFEGRLGGYVNKNLAIEARAGVGFIGDELGSRDVDLNYTFGGYTRLGLPVDKAFPYLLLGFTRAEVGFSNPDEDVSETDASYGVGVDLNALNLTLNLEYVALVDKNGMDFGGFTFGFTTTF